MSGQGLLAFFKGIIETHGIAVAVLLAVVVGLGFLVYLFVKWLISDREKKAAADNTTQMEMLRQYGTLVTNHMAHLAASIDENRTFQKSMGETLVAQTELLKAHTESVKSEHAKGLSDHEDMGRTMSRIEGRMDGWKKPKR